VLFDLHRAVGLGGFAVLAVIAFTGLYMDLPAVIEPAVAAFSVASKRGYYQVRFMPPDDIMGCANCAPCADRPSGMRIGGVCRSGKHRPSHALCSLPHRHTWEVRVRSPVPHGV
jgi:hypothetical protein